MNDLKSEIEDGLVNISYHHIAKLIAVAKKSDVPAVIEALDQLKKAISGEIKVKPGDAIEAFNDFHLIVKLSHASEMAVD